VKLKWFAAIAVLCVLLIPAVANATTLHSATYTWYDTGGTVVSQTHPTISQWIVGDVSGKEVVKVEEDVFAWDQVLNPPAGTLPGSNRYVYTVSALDEVGLGTVGDGTGGLGITDFHIMDHWGVGAGSVQTGPGYLGWTSLDNPFTGPSWDWIGGMPIGLNSGTQIASLNSFEIYTPVQWGYTTGTVTYGNNQVLAGGVMSGPVVPEPGTLLLLGGGLIGLAGFAWRRKKKQT
jgi:hypothetical protein